MPLPKFTEEDYKAAEKEINSKAPAKKPAGTRTSASGAPVRSLHHIDDEEYEQPTPAPEKKKSTQKKDSLIEQAPLKSDEDEKDSEDAE